MNSIKIINGIHCKILKSKRKTLAVEVTENCEVILRLPKKATYDDAERLVKSHETWILKAIQKQKTRYSEKYTPSPEEEKALREIAEKILPERTEYWSNITGLKPTGIRITSARKRFGSCNTKNSLCFSYLLMLYPPEAIDYVIVHELCHIKHKNHGYEFYKTVEKFYPKFREAEKLLKNPPKKNPFR